jgi:YggT family protein
MGLETALLGARIAKVVLPARPAHRDRAQARLATLKVNPTTKKQHHHHHQPHASSSRRGLSWTGRCLASGETIGEEEPTSVGARSVETHSVQPLNVSGRNITKAFAASSALFFAGGAPACFAAIGESSNEVYDLGALDAASASAVALILKPAIGLASFFMIVRIVLTWFPETKSKEFPWLVFYYTTEPVLSFTRAIFQPVGGVDISPIIWVAFLSFMNEILVGPQGILILLQNKV